MLLKQHSVDHSSVHWDSWGEITLDRIHVYSWIEWNRTVQGNDPFRMESPRYCSNLMWLCCFWDILTRAISHPVTRVCASLSSAPVHFRVWSHRRSCHDSSSLQWGTTLSRIFLQEIVPSRDYRRRSRREKRGEREEHQGIETRIYACVANGPLLTLNMLQSEETS